MSKRQFPCDKLNTSLITVVRKETLVYPVLFILSKSLHYKPCSSVKVILLEALMDGVWYFVNWSDTNVIVNS